MSEENLQDILPLLLGHSLLQQLVFLHLRDMEAQLVFLQINLELP